jgi:hypothetical protein
MNKKDIPDSIMLSLAEAISNNLKDNGLFTEEISYRDLIDGRVNLRTPAANIVFNNATVKKVTVNTYKYVTIVSILLVTKWLVGGEQGAAQRKGIIYALIEEISNYLTLQDFGLPLENPLYPMGFFNVTPKSRAEAGYQIYELRFWTAWNVTKADQYPDSLNLKSIVAEYNLVPGLTGAQPPQASDIITFS